jgi:1-acylglycerone phosphate reductase
MAAITRKTCLITGCSGGGVGSALAEAFQAKGYHVFATARSPSKIPQSLHTSPNVTVLALDVTSSESIAAAAETIRAKTGGKLDILINNAGHGLNMPALDTSITEAKKLFNTNFFGVLEMVQVFQHMLIRSKGAIVNNSSMGAYLPIPFISTPSRPTDRVLHTDLPSSNISSFQSRSNRSKRRLASRTRTSRCPRHHARHWRCCNELPR